MSAWAHLSSDEDKALLKKRMWLGSCPTHCFNLPCLKYPRDGGFLRLREGRGLAQGHTASLGRNRERFPSLWDMLVL